MKSNESVTLEKIALEKLARSLAINNYNISLAESNYSKSTEEVTPGLDRIFKRKPTDEELLFSRNILIVGAGASRNSYDFIKTADEVKTLLQKNLGLHLLLGFNQKEPTFLWNKYVEIASRISNNVFDQNSGPAEVEFNKITKLLSFEQNLEVLSYFFRRQDIGKAIQSLIHFRYMPTLPYELIAHLFKHRYIDIVINLNFDELLDNAIEDEMGATKYHRVVEGEKIVPFENIVDHGRLRIPIYIKLHGSIFSRSSLKYTNEQYIDIPYEFKELLNKVFSGYTGQPDGRGIKVYNIIFCGYGLNDLDIQHMLFKHLLSSCADRDIVINYFGFVKDPDEFKNRFVLNFGNWLTRNAEIGVEATDSLFNIITNTHDISIDSNYELNELEDKSSLGSKLLELVNYIALEYQEPFKPKAPTRHTLLAELFPRNGIINDVSPVYAKEFFQRRSKFYCLFDFVKYVGIVPLNLITNDRASKYYDLWTSVDNAEHENLIQYLQTLFSEDLKFWEISRHHLRFLPLVGYSNKLNGKLNDVLYRLAEQMCSNSYTKRAKDRGYIDRIAAILQQEVLGTRTNEINAVYNDPKHKVFHKFPNRNVICTNLELTWRFFEYAALRMDDWDMMLINDDSGKCLFNLYNEASLTPCYLTNIAVKGKKVILCYSHGDLEAKDKRNNGKPVNIIKTITEKFSEAKNPGNLKTLYVGETEHSMHKMALFVKINNGVKIPVFGIYYFKPSAKVRINPVFFKANDNEPSQLNNLNQMLSIFMRDVGEDVIRN